MTTARILVFEDEHAIRIALKGLLSREGYEVALAEDGERACAAVARERSSQTNTARVGRTCGRGGACGSGTG